MGIFSRKKKKVEINKQIISTLISEGCVFDGNLTAPAFVRIEGQINGDVTVDEGLIVGEKGLITGNVITKEMIVYGKVHGKISASSLAIRSTGRITGDIKIQVLTVEPGGTHNGKLSMTSTPFNNIQKVETASTTSEKVSAPSASTNSNQKSEAAPQQNGKSATSSSTNGSQKAEPANANSDKLPEASNGKNGHKQVKAEPVAV